jgi:hypothetical protein
MRLLLGLVLLTSAHAASIVRCLSVDPAFSHNFGAECTPEIIADLTGRVGDFGWWVRFDIDGPNRFNGIFGSEWLEYRYHDSASVTLVARGGLGPGFLYGARSDCELGREFPADHVTITTRDSFLFEPSSCIVTSDSFARVPIVFNQPFTMFYELDVVVSGWSTITMDMSRQIGIVSILDADGNPVSGATLTAVPEPGTLGGTVAAALTLTLFTALRRSRRC